MLNQNQDNTEYKKRIPVVLGVSMVTLGAVLLFDQLFKTGWLSWAAISLVGVLFLVEGTRNQKIGWLIPGSLFLVAGIGAFLVFGKDIWTSVPQKVGILFVSLAIGGCLITITTTFGGGKIAWWPLIPTGVFLSLGLCLWLSDLSFLAFVFYMVTGVGLILLVWGIFSKLIGLVIPGSLLVTIGPGISIAWGTTFASNPLAKTGLMIAAFSFGWGLIVLFARVISSKLVWWPLIPGGILAMVGLGLYIGGDPGNAPSFIANTGSVALIIFGLYLLLLRKSIHR
jgi:hypothetical protein